MWLQHGVKINYRNNIEHWNSWPQQRNQILFLISTPTVGTLHSSITPITVHVLLSFFCYWNSSSELRSIAFSLKLDPCGILGLAGPPCAGGAVDDPPLWPDFPPPEPFPADLDDFDELLLLFPFFFFSGTDPVPGLTTPSAEPACAAFPVTEELIPASPVPTDEDGPPCWLLKSPLPEDPNLELDDDLWWPPPSRSNPSSRGLRAESPAENVHIWYQEHIYHDAIMKLLCHQPNIMSLGRKIGKQKVAYKEEYVTITKYNTTPYSWKMLYRKKSDTTNTDFQLHAR